MSVSLRDGPPGLRRGVWIGSLCFFHPADLEMLHVAVSECGGDDGTVLFPRDRSGRARAVFHASIYPIARQKDEMGMKDKKGNFDDECSVTKEGASIRRTPMPSLTLRVLLCAAGYTVRADAPYDAARSATPQALARAGGEGEGAGLGDGLDGAALQQWWLMAVELLGASPSASAECVAKRRR
jgi:hypothetical protein